ncbi:uncharacterized protein LODBEIA_P38050 [Lodderomyces beijingensis]|uniref:Glycoside hydrolase family 76 protein n=1 Tax=Lodderomyces beijingensis TaxID=1775926 RepID=A0ABP0ZN61_9ASCO
MAVLIIFCLVQLAFATPITKRAAFDPAGAYQSALNATWSTFWNAQYQSFNSYDPSCNPAFNYAVVWDAAVAAKAVVDSKDVDKTNLVISSLYKYQNPQGWFTSSPGGNEIYTDDNAQVLWVFLEAWSLTNNQTLLTTATNLMHLIQSQWSSVGGVTWKVGSSYIASISTAEAAFSAAKLYQYVNDASLLTFATSCLAWLDQHLTDPSDGFYYDGLSKDTWQVNKGKLTYTVGAAISAYTYLYKATGNASYLNIAMSKATATLTKPTFLNSNGAWNNPLCYVHLLFAGFADLITIGHVEGYNPSLFTQANFVYLFDQLGRSGHYASSYTSVKSSFANYVSIAGSSSGVSYAYDAGNYCSGNENQPLRTALTDGSAAQIFYSISKLT